MANKSIEEQRKIAQARAERLEEREYSPEEEKMLKKMSDEFYDEYLKSEIEKAKKDAKKGN